MNECSPTILGGALKRNPFETDVLRRAVWRGPRVGFPSPECAVIGERSVGTTFVDNICTKVQGVSAVGKGIKRPIVKNNEATPASNVVDSVGAEHKLADHSLLSLDEINVDFGSIRVARLTHSDDESPQEADLDEA